MGNRDHVIECCDWIEGKGLRSNWKKMGAIEKLLKLYEKVEVIKSKGQMRKGVRLGFWGLLFT